MYQRILVPIDGSSACHVGLQEALKLCGETTKLCLVYVLESIYPLDSESMLVVDYQKLHEALSETGKRALIQAENIVQAAGVAVEAVLIDAASENVAHAIQKQADTWQADLIVMATHGRSGFNRILMGSVAESVVRLVTVPVLLVREKANLLK